MITWHQKIKLARERLGMTKSELANLVGISPSAITQWENGETKNIDGGNLVAVARALRVSAEWLMDKRNAELPPLEEEANPALERVTHAKAELRELLESVNGEARLLLVYRMTSQDGRKAIDAAVNLAYKRSNILDVLDEGETKGARSA